MASNCRWQPGPAGLRPYGIGAATALVCLLCFAWPPLRRLSLASPLRVLRRDMPLEQRRTLTDYAIGLAAVSGLMWWYSGDWMLTAAVLAGLAATVVLGLVLALTLLRGGRLVGMSAGSVWRLAFAGLQRRGNRQCPAGRDFCHGDHAAAGAVAGSNLAD